MQLSRSIVLAFALTAAVPSHVQTHGNHAASAFGNLLGKLHCSVCQPKVLKISAVVACAACYIRLVTKSSPKVKVDRTWAEFFTKCASLLNITQLGTSAYWNTFDQVIVGDQFKLIDKSTKTEDENGDSVTYKDKSVKTSPSGIFGYFDAYILRNLKAIFENLENLEKGKTLFDGMCS